MASLLDSIPPEYLDDVYAIAGEDPLVADWLQMKAVEPFFSEFIPRPDDPAAFDEQHSFCYNRDQVSFCVGGNGAGTSECAAFKTSLFLLQQQPPPRKDTPFWIIANNYEQVCDVCWSEKLLGHGHIPECEVDWNRVTWHSQKEARPRSVPLKPWPKNRGGDSRKNWRIEFKSYEQGREAMQARSIGGFWFSEQFPLDIFLEVLRGCREYMFPGGQFSEFTPIDPELSLWVEKVMDDPPPGWKFYRMNTEKNRVNLEEGWYEQFFALVPEEMRETRQTGALASFEGVIYPSFNMHVHVLDESKVVVPHGAYHSMATDWGASAEHPFAAAFACRDSIGHWLCYDEYWCPDQTRTNRDHACEFLDKLTAWGWPIEIVKDPETGKPMYYEDGRVVRRLHAGRDALWGSNHGDPARPDMLREFSMLGIETLAARNAVYDGINCVRTALKRNVITGEPGLVISSKCKHLIEEMRKYRWKPDRSKSGTRAAPDAPRPVPLKRGDDLVDCIRYLLYSNAADISSVIGSTRKQGDATDRRSVQFVRSQLQRAMKGALPGLIPPRQ